MDGQKGADGAGITGLFQQLVSFCRRLSESKGFRRATRILFWVLVAYLIYSFAIFMIAVMHTGTTFRQALSFFLKLPLLRNGRFPSSASVFYGIAIGLIWHFRRRRNKRNESEAAEEDAKPAGPEPVQEEEPVITTRYQSR